MSSSSVGVVMKDIAIYDIFQYIKEKVDPNATISSFGAGRSNWILFQYGKEKRDIHVYEDSIDYQESTHYTETSTCLSMGKHGVAAEQVLKPMVEYFGGFYIPDDCEDECIFFPFNDKLIDKYPIEKAILNKLSDEKDWTAKIKIMLFVKNNIDFISKISELHPPKKV